MSVTAIVQARMSSSRLPGKTLRPLGSRPVLDWVVRAAAESGAIDTVVVATSVDASDDPIVAHCAERGVACVRGALDDVVDRFTAAATAYPADIIVRLTADCPMLDPGVIRQAVLAFEAASGTVDYLSTVLVRSLPRGLDVEVFSADTLRQVASHATGADRVHVTSAIYADPTRYRLAGLIFAPDSSDLRITLDTPADAVALDDIVAVLGDRPPAWRELVALLRSRPDIVAHNAAVRQKEISEG